MRTRPNDERRAAVVAAAFAAGTIIAQQVAAKTARDALFLAEFAVGSLPGMMIAAALVSLLAALLAAGALARRAPSGLLLTVLGANAVLYLVEWSLLARFPRAAAVMLYAHVAAFGATLIAAFWALVNERYDPHTAKRQVAHVALGGTLGGLFGGISSWILGSAGGVSPLLLMLASLNVACMVGVLVAGRGRHSAERPRQPRPPERAKPPGFSNTRYLWLLAALVGLSGVTSSSLDYVLSARATIAFHDARELAAFFSLFHAVVGLLAVLVQLTLSRAALERLGLAGSVALLPGAVLAVGAFGLGAPGLWSATLLRGAEGLVQNSLYRSAYELLYTPLPRGQKRPAKMLIDVGVDRIGTIAGAALAALVVSRLGASAPTTLVVVAMLCAALGLACTARLHGAYVQALASSLRRGAVRLDSERVLDATTRRTLAESTGLDRRELLQAIEQHRSDRPSAVQPPVADADPDNSRVAALADLSLLGASGGAGFMPPPSSLTLVKEQAETDVLESDPILRKVADLRSGDASRIRDALSGPMLPELAGHVIPLLGRDEVARAALHALRQIAPRITGQLSDALNDLELGADVRRRVPRALERTASESTVRALLQGILDADFDVRQQCALALLRLTEERSNLQVPKDQVLEALRQELERGRGLAPRADHLTLSDQDTSFSNAALATRVHHGIEHLMVLLSLALEREPLRLAYHALYSSDEAIRGTALEYLENVLPDGLKAPLLAELEQHGLARRQTADARRDRSVIVAELLRSREMVMPSSIRARS